MCSDCHSGEHMWQEKGNRSVIMTQRGKGKEGAWLRPLASPVADMVLGFTELTLHGCVTAGDASSCLGLLMLGTPGCLCSGPPRGSGPPPHARDWRHRPRARCSCLDIYMVASELEQSLLLSCLLDHDPLYELGGSKR